MNSETKVLVPDFTYHMVRSNPFRIVLNSTTEERMDAILHRGPVTKWYEGEGVAQAHRKSDSDKVNPFLALFGMKQSLESVHVADVHIRKNIRETAFMLAELQQAPQQYNPNVAKHYEVEAVVSDSEKYAAKYLQETNDDNNFIISAIMGRAISSWIDWKHITAQEFQGGLTIKRETESSLPVGEYVFKLLPISLVIEKYRIDTDYILPGISDYSQWELLQEEATPKLGIGDPVTITIVLSKSSNHTKGGSVETKPKGKKDKQSAEQGTPDLQLDR